MISEYREIEYNVGDHVIVLVPETEKEREDTDQFNAGFDHDMFHYDRSIGVIDMVGDVRPNGRRTYNIRFEDGETWFWDPFYMRPASEAATLDPDVKDFNWHLNEFLRERLDIDTSEGTDYEIEELSEFLMDQGFPEFIEDWGEMVTVLKSWRTEFPALTVEEPGKYGLAANTLSGRSRPKNHITIADFLAEMRKVYKFCVTAEDFESILD